jgi:hypothetical protein
MQRAACILGAEDAEFEFEHAAANLVPEPVQAGQDSLQVQLTDVDMR